MDAVAAHLPIASSSGSFLITPNVGEMIWVIVVFAISLFILAKWVYPPISAALERRAQQIAGEIDAAEQTRVEAEKILEEYRERLHDAREQAEEILQRSQKTAQSLEARARDEAEARRQEALERTRRDIEAVTRRAIGEIRREVADLTVVATEKMTRKVLDDADQRRLVEEALQGLDFEALATGGEGR
jgi:F-type H+-transporting ATPase subunit b